METPTQHFNVFNQLDSWKLEVNQVRGDVKRMRDELSHLCTGKHPNERMANVEHFQNQFIRQLEVADEMYHDIKQVVRNLNNTRIEHADRPVDDVPTLQNRMATFHKIYGELAQDFQQFQAHRF
ncbi:hypothetical protein LX64_02882 [Chitinophaga skermanii]|uniref:Uncharacterized protein n=1 Tax=Chitinophaga skermanii TaxID=331697 RepID=A0A327QJ36_9BACT|nr:hypothetical protein [Chitinophaga skermanii]RAJ04005.1 hypothetical protein LX64_02882 [Chitinophaga skermanii]